MFQVPKIRESVLEQLLRLPTAPFKEMWVLEFIAYQLEQAHVPYFVDPVGNIVAGIGSENEYLKMVKRQDPEPVRIFMAHADHPGFHVTKVLSDRKVQFEWHGGAPVKHLKGARVGIASLKELGIRFGKIDAVKLSENRRTIQSGTILLDEPLTDEDRKEMKTAFGSFAFSDSYFRRGDLIYTKAADDLVGCFAMIELLKKQFSRKKKSKAPFMALFTRAEEVGFIGMIGHLKLGWLEHATRPIVFVSLETSRALPGAVIGKGPVVRLGDRMSVFHPHGIQQLTHVANRVLPGKYQKRMMDGGTCEASVAVAAGYPAIGISVPLGNYHNQSFEGGPDSKGSMGPAPEFVHLSDIQGMIELCNGLVSRRFPEGSPWKETLLGFEKQFRKYEKYLF